MQEKTPKKVQEKTQVPVILDLEKGWGTVIEDYFAQEDAAEDADREAERRCSADLNK